MTMTCEIFPGEKGIDASFHYPSGASILAAGYTFAIGYISPNPKKNIPLAVILDWIACGLGVWLVWEVNAGQTSGGEPQGLIDGQIANRQATTLTCPYDVAVIAANDTDTTGANIEAEYGYMRGFYNSVAPFMFGGYMDIDLGARVNKWPYTKLLTLPNAWAWDHPNPKLKTVAIQQATDLGYHLIQGRLTDDPKDPSYDNIDGIAVDILHCIRQCTAWGNPREETDMSDTITFQYNGGIYMWHPAMTSPIPFTDVEQAQNISNALKAPSCALPMTEEMFSRLVRADDGSLTPVKFPLSVSLQGTGVINES